MSRQGNLSINSENIFPIIKKWLYSDHDIFIRELISNASDAILKFKKLSSIGEITDNLNEAFKITVTLDEANGTITVSDNGIGMTEEEIEKYITQIAFSGAEDFLQQYKDKMDHDQIIGHFGLGFYSSFMVSSLVEIETLSYNDNATPVHWSCDGGTTYEIAEGTREKRGTDVILHIAEESKEFLDFYKLSQIIQKYCSFMPVPIYVVSKKEEDEKQKDSDTKKEGDENISEEEFAPINDVTPLYVKQPSDCTEEEYISFYNKTFLDLHEPLFWIHLNMDYPFNLKGILYFPKLKHELETIEGKIKLYNNQVFVAENIKEVIPEFLLLLKGIIDCPDLPLNVSRSSLQNDGFVKKVSDYITKKVADKLISLYKKEPDNYKKFWDDISPFIKYGCLREEKFYEKVKEALLFKTIDDEYITLEEYLAKVKDKNENKIFYVSDKKQQSQYINIFKEANLSAVYLEHSIDNPFISHLEHENSGIKFMRIDADISAALKEEHENKDDDKAEEEKLTELFKKALNKDNLKISIENLKTENIASMLLIGEDNRRMQEMIKMYSMDFMMGQMPNTDATLVLNRNHPLIQILSHKDLDDEKTKMVCEHLYDLALLSNQTLSPEQMGSFLERSTVLLLMLTK